MANPSKYFSGEGPSRPHLSTGEIADLRSDTESAFERVAADLLLVKMNDAADVTGGGTTRIVGFQVTDVSGTPVTESVLLQFASFDDSDLSMPSTNATLDTASQGTIIAGGGTAALLVKTSPTGLFECVLTDLADETVYLACDRSFGSPFISCRETDSVSFSA